MCGQSKAIYPLENFATRILERLNSLTIDTLDEIEKPFTENKRMRAEGPMASTHQPSIDDHNLLAQTQYARSARAINSLRDLGIDRMEVSADLGIEPLKISLPKIALVGNQSSGKSSLIEAISQIKLPQDVGTCTRCPMEVRLCEETEKREWSCTVSLRFNSQLEHERPRTEFFAKTSNKGDVEIILRRAQLAILNPNQAIENFVNLDVATHTAAPARPFSEDMIVVDIVGAPVNVTFIDLPGITNPDNDVHKNLFTMFR